MSPASQGNLEVERFIGSNLISSWGRANNGPRSNGKGRKPESKPGKPALQRTGVSNNNNNNANNTGEQYSRYMVRTGYQKVGSSCDCNGNYSLAPRTQHWTGMPLISGKKKNVQFQKNVFVEDESGLRTPLSRLAIHTQGAPLILAGRCNPSRKNQNRGTPPRANRGDLGARRSNKYKDNHSHGLNGTSDCLSVASDESSGSSLSENCLPRIIKPRKRRKKDRKPVAGSEVPAKNDVKPPEPSPDEKTCDNRPKQDAKISTGSHLDEVSEDELHCPKLHHSFDDVAESESYVYSVSSCQCHYCDPSGIWGENFFPNTNEGPSYLTQSPDPGTKTFHYSAHSDLVLRRSWSEPLPPQAQASKTPESTIPQRSNSFSLAESWKLKELEDTHRWEVTGKGLNKKENGSYNITASHPPQRPWIPFKRPNRTRPTCIFTVMCYNVLCDKYATRQMYGYCPSWALDWEYRKKGILEEIRNYAADIISLQEVETDQFYNFFLPELKRDGYDGIFSPKSRAKTMSENDRKFVDGCAIFFRTAKFSLIKNHLVEFNQLAMANSEGSDHMLNRVMPKDNIGLAALLKTKEAAWDNGLPSDPNQINQPIVVCTAHIHWDPEFCDVKLIQTMMLSYELKGILEEASHSFRPGHKPDTNSVQLLLCGDFNSLPDSGVIEFLSSGRVSADHPDFKELQYKSVLQKISGCEKPNEFTHSFKLASAYSEDIMPFTNYTFDFKGIIDYIFYSKQSMTPLGLLGPVSAEWLKENKVVGCPHPHVPSDHFPLLVELEMCPTVPSTSNGLISRR